MNNIILFKETHKRFSEALRYIVENDIKLRDDPVKWKTIKQNFQTKFAEPLDLAWNNLSEKEKERFSTLYFSRREIQDEVVQKMLKIFGGKIVNIKKEY